MPPKNEDKIEGNAKATEDAGVAAARENADVPVTTDAEARAAASEASDDDKAKADQNKSQGNTNDPNTGTQIASAPTGGTHRVSHKEPGPRGFYTEANGDVSIPAEGSADVTLTDAEVKRLKGFDIFEIEDLRPKAE